MKKKRTIILRTPEMRKIRNNIRSLILNANRAVQLRIYDEIEKIKTPDYFKSHPPELMGDLKKLYEREQQIERAVRASILLCPACFQSDKDMTYNPVLKTWYCIDCYAKLKKGYAEDGQADQFP